MLQKMFDKTRFAQNVFYVPTAATEGVGIDLLVDTIKSNLRVPRRTADGPFLLSYDHAFAIKGHGTIVTGTVLSGSVTPG